MKIFHHFLFLIVIMFSLPAMAQDKSVAVKATDSEDDYPLLIIDHQEFEEQFCLFKTSDSKANYFAIDLDKLPDAFSKAYFMDLIYQQKKIVSIDADFDKNYLWFKSFKLYAPEEILKQFSQLKTKTDHAVENFSDEKKSLWLKVNNKY